MDEFDMQEPRYTRIVAAQLAEVSVEFVERCETERLVQIRVMRGGVPRCTSSWVSTSPPSKSCCTCAARCWTCASRWNGSNRKGSSGKSACCANWWPCVAVWRKRETAAETMRFGRGGVATDD
jgi:coenzyme F420-reducing hydrogenase gamma subunit